jgi:hypothetical protein
MEKIFAWIDRALPGEIRNLTFASKLEDNEEL